MGTHGSIRTSIAVHITECDHAPDILVYTWICVDGTGTRRAEHSRPVVQAQLAAHEGIEVCPHAVEIVAVSSVSVAQ